MAKKSFFEDVAPETPAAPTRATLDEKREAYRVAAEGGMASRKELEAMRQELRLLETLL